MSAPFARGDGDDAGADGRAAADPPAAGDGEAWPLGERVWGDTALLLPTGSRRSDEWIDLFTGRR